MPVKGGAYEQGLHEEYIKLAKDEDSESDWSDASKFSDRAKMAAMGKPTGPEALTDRKLDTKHAGQLSDARARLIAALENGGAQKAGTQAALAQTSFDCWMQEAEENLQPEHIEACRKSFYTALPLLEAAVASPVKPVARVAPAPEPVAPRTQHFLVYFGFDSDSIDATGSTTVKSAVDFIKEKKTSNIYVAGHADRAGSKEYNMALAKKRVDAVAASLTGMGVKKAGIGTLVQGETDPAVQTQDGLKEPGNRRVVISVVY